VGQPGLGASLEVSEGMIGGTMFFIMNSVLKRFAFLIVFFVPGFLLPSVHALESAERIIRELDAYYYYPQRQGLEKLSVLIDWEQLDVVSDSGRYLKNPSVAFHWEKGQRSKGVFKLADESFEISATRKKDLLNLLENYKEVLIPETLAEKFSHFKGRVITAKKRRRWLAFSARNPDAAIQKYDLMVDLKQKNIRRFRMERNAAPVEIKSDVRYTQKDGKWLTAESRSRFRMGEMEYVEITEFVYRRVDNFWMMGEMTQTVKTDDRVLQSFIFRFHDYEIN
jgi:hypothetical protein